MNPTCEACGGKCCDRFTFEYGPKTHWQEWQFRDELDRIGRMKNVFVDKIDPVLKTAQVTFVSYCENFDVEKGQCGDYEHRPATCRLYKCDKLRKA